MIHVNTILNKSNPMNQIMNTNEMLTQSRISNFQIHSQSIQKLS